jgi:hypothetical protein
LPQYQVAHVKVVTGFEQATITKQERASKNKAWDYTEQHLSLSIVVKEAESKVLTVASRVPTVSIGLTRFIHLPPYSQIYVRSESDPDVFYSVPYTTSSDHTCQISRCTCESFVKTSQRCKHMFMCERFFGSSRLQAVPDVGRGPTMDGAASDAEGDTDDEDGDGMDLQGGTASACEPSNADTCNEWQLNAHNKPSLSAPWSSLIPASQGTTDKPPPSSTQQAKDQKLQDATAQKQEFDDLLNRFTNMSMSNPVRESSFDLTLMVAVKADVEAMYHRWQEAIGIRHAGAEQRRYY